MKNDITLYKKSSKLNLNQTPPKSVIETLINYSKSLQFINTSIGKIVIANN